MTQDRFARSYGPVVIGLAVAWRSALLFACGTPLNFGATVFGIGLGVLPFAALTLLARRVRAKWVLKAGAAAALLVDVCAALLVLLGRSSTAGIGLLFAPFATVITIVPAIGVLARLSDSPTAD